MIDQKVIIKAPIKIIPSKNYYLVIEDADGVRHYFNDEHDDCVKGEYDGWSTTDDEKGKKMLNKGWLGEMVQCDACTHKWTAVFPESCDTLECPNCHIMAGYEIVTP